MTVPGRVAAAALLLWLEPPAWFMRHAAAVAESAAWLARACHGRGEVVDPRLVEAAALLHDVDKLLPAGDPAASLPHGEGSAAWLSRRGHPELAIVAAHPVTRLLDEAWFETWRSSASLEERLVAYADKRAGQRLEAMAARFASWQRRYPAGWTADEGDDVRARAAALEADVCARAGVSPDEVRRLAWVHEAVRQARREQAA